MPKTFVTGKGKHLDKLMGTADKYTTKWKQWVEKAAEAYRTKNVLIPYGEDFAHRNAEVTLNLAKAMIEDLNLNYGDKLTAKFSSIQNYVQSVYTEAKKSGAEFEVEGSDFWKINHR